MRIASVTWNNETDNTKVTFSDDFVESDRITKLDVLKDLMIMFTGVYNDVCGQVEKGTSVIDKKYTRYGE